MPEASAIPMTDEDPEMQRALAMSISYTQPYDTRHELLPPDQRLRDKDLPSGLRNIGSTCYFNSLLQVYYSLPQFVTTILAFKDEEKSEAQDVVPG